MSCSIPMYVRLALAAVLMSRMIAPARAGDKPAADDTKEQERQKWESRILFYGEEDTGDWSLRVLDKAAVERAKVLYQALWKYDPGDRKWKRIDNGHRPVQILFPDEKDPADPPDSQLIAELPIKHNAIGLYYATWQVNDQIDGASFCRIGPALVGQAAKDAAHPPKPPEKYIVAIVPLTASKAELQIIPDPRVVTAPSNDNAPSTRPVR